MITPDDLNRMTPAEINTARRSGQLDHILNPATTAAPTETPEGPPEITTAVLTTMTPDAINQARRSGQLDHLLHGRP